MKCVHCTINYIPIKFVKIKVLICLFIVKIQTTIYKFQIKYDWNYFLIQQKYLI